MPKQITIRAGGVNVQPNDMGAPDGSLVVADNVVISRDDIIETRRGFERITAAGTFARLFSFKDGLVAWGDGVLWYSPAGDYSGTSWAIQNTITVARADGRMRAATVGRSLYFAADDATYRADDLSTPPRKAGLPVPLEVITGTGNPGNALLPDSQVAYRLVYGSRDAYGRLILSPPSGRSIQVSLGVTAIRVQRTSNVVTVTYTVGSSYFPAASETFTMFSGDAAFSSGVKTCIASNSGAGTFTYAETAADAVASGEMRFSRGSAVVGVLSASVPPSGPITFMQLYRTWNSARSDVAPGDEMSLALEVAVTPDGTWRNVTLYDDTPDELLGAALYTNPSQEGALAGNYTPPAATDLAAYRGSLFFADLRRPATLTVQLLGGVQSGDSVTINGVSYTLQVYTGGTPAQNIANSARAFCHAVTSDLTGTANAYYVSAENDLPGRIRLEARDPSLSLTFSPSRAVSWSPSASTTMQPERAQNAIAWSKTSQSDSVPPKYSATVGSGDNSILRLIPTRDSLFILKREEGVWRASGTNADDLRIDPFDYNTNLVGTDTAVALDNRVYLLSQQGVVQMTDTGVELMSRAIEPYLFPLLVGQMRAVTERLAFAIAVESDRKYILFLPSAPSDTACTQAWVYDTITRAWTRWVKGALHGIANPADNRLYLIAPAPLPGVLRERKTFTDNDLADESYQVAISGNAYERSFQVDNVALVSVGDLVGQGSSTAHVTGIDVSTSTVTVDTAGAWAAGVVTGVKAIPSTVEWVPRFAPPGLMHRFAEVAIGFRRLEMDFGVLTFTGDGSVGMVCTPADVLWTDHPVLRAIVPRAAAAAASLRIRWSHVRAQSAHQIQALSVTYSPGTSPVRRHRAVVAIAGTTTPQASPIGLDQPLDSEMA